MPRLFLLLALAIALASTHLAAADPADSPVLPKATIDGEGLGWVKLGEADFAEVNCGKECWSFSEGMIHCKGTPVGVLRTAKQYTNFELSAQWRHNRSAGNSGFFVWVPESSLNIKPGQLPKGIEVQVLDHGYAEQYEKNTGKKGDWFTTNGDIFAVGVKLSPFPPLSPDKSRSFPRKNVTKGVGEWNHYYIRAINGEVRLWVNGEEVSGGNGADPKSGFLCLESEGSPIDFKNLSIRELP